MKCDEEEAKATWKTKMSARDAYLQQIEYKKKLKQDEIREKEKEKLAIELMIQKNREMETAGNNLHHDFFFC